jgi:hypothetical protein
MIASFNEDESVAWPSYVDFLSTFAILMILFAGYMAFLLANGVNDTAFIADTGQQKTIEGTKTTIDANRRQVQINLNDVLQFESGCPLKSQGCAPISDETRHHLQQIARQIESNYPHALTVSVQGRADNAPGSSPYRNMEVAGDRALRVFEIVDQCQECSEEFRSKLRIYNVGDRETQGVGPEFRTVFLILDYSMGGN